MCPGDIPEYWGSPAINLLAGYARPIVDFVTAWAVSLRDVSSDEEDGVERDIVSVLRVFWKEQDALDEVYRLRQEDPDEDHLYYCEQTEAERQA